MSRLFRSILRTAAAMLFTIVWAQLASAQITNQVRVTMSHPFIVGEKTLPPGQYTLRVVSNSDMSVMTIRSKDGTESAEFLVRQSDAKHVPKHTELVFDRIGNEEFLHRVYEKGDRLGVAVGDVSKEEARLEKSGQHGTEHTEEMPD